MSGLPEPPEGLSSMPEVRLGEQGQIVGEDVCRECGTDVGAGYLCDECDTVGVKDNQQCYKDGRQSATKAIRCQYCLENTNNLGNHLRHKYDEI